MTDNVTTPTDGRLTAKRHEFMFRRGSSDVIPHQIVKGWAARSSITHTGRRVITGFLLPGDYCNLADGPLDHDIVALTPITLQPLNGLDDTAGGMSYKRAHALLSAEVKMMRQLALAVTAGATERIAYLLHTLALRQSLEAVEERSYPLPLTQTDIGDALNLTAVHVNRTLRNYLADVAICRDGFLRVLDASVLRRRGSI